MNIVVTIEQIMDPGHSPAEPIRPADLRVIQGKPWLEYVLDMLPPPSYADFAFTVQESCQRMFSLAELIRLHRPQSRVIIVPDGAKGPSCSVLMASEHLPASELCVVSGNQFLRCDLQEVIEELRNSSADAGTVIFDSLHPRWPHLQLDPSGEVMEVSETSLLSRMALAGIYYFRSGADFLRAAEQVIRKDNHVHGRFSLAPTLNELILAGKRIFCASIAGEDFVPLSTDADFCDLPALAPRTQSTASRTPQFRVYSPPA